MQEEDQRHIPTRIGAILFSGKALALQMKRGLSDFVQGIRRHPVADASAFTHLYAESRTPLWSRVDDLELALQRGKVHNLRRAVRRLDGVVIPANEIFSFWKQIGCASRRQGYVDGRILQEGCLIPATGGGLCQLSNALYAVALDSGCIIVERHAHSRVIPGSAAEIGRDATVAWNYIDLRFQSPHPLLLKARLTPDTLIVSIYGQVPGLKSAEARQCPVTALPLEVRAHSCATCGMEGCFRHRNTACTPDANEVRAFLLDECWPEFQQYVEQIRQPEDVLAVPFRANNLRPQKSCWDAQGYKLVRTAPFEAALRSLVVRRYAKHGAPRIQGYLKTTQAIAVRLASRLGPDVRQICVAQSLLPFLWREGALGGRHFEVFMTRLPLSLLHKRLDEALAEHPDRSTLGEFRAPAWIVEAETEALAASDRVITPHSEIAALFPDKAMLLDWRLPKPASVNQGTRIAFVGPTAARKGAYELRAVARELDLEILLCGSELEGSGFWNGVRTSRPEGNWLDGVAAVVQPALVEDCPRRLLSALASGVPVIATEACGLGERQGLTIIPWDEEEALKQAITIILKTDQ